VLVTAVAGAIAGVAFGAYYAVAIAPNINPKLKTYWDAFYLSGSPLHMLHEGWLRLSHMSTMLAMPAFVFVALFALGIGVLVRLRAVALAVAVPFLWFEMAAAARASKYPFLDLRTSHFLLMSSYVVIAIGVAGVVLMLAAVRVPNIAPASKAVAAIVGGVAIAAFLGGSARYVGDLHIPAENVRAETLAVARTWRPGDVIVISQPSNFGFSYYWPGGHVVFRSSDAAQGFRAEVTNVPVIYTRGRTYVDVLAALRAGKHTWRERGATSRLFIVRTHLSPGEAHAWATAIERLHLAPRKVAVGSDPLLVVGSP
jgi:hypothetical protein